MALVYQDMTFVQTSVDDVIVHSMTLANHVCRVRRAFEALTRTNLLTNVTLFAFAFMTRVYRSISENSLIFYTRLARMSNGS